MPPDILDNRESPLSDRINQYLATAETARWVVGYCFLPGLEAVHTHLDGPKQIRLLIGNTVSRDTLEQLSETYGHLDPAQAAEQREKYPSRAERRKQVEGTAETIRGVLAVMEQTEAHHDLVGHLIRLLEEQRLAVRVYTRGRIHTKAYLFDYPDPGHPERGIAIVGTSNLTLAGLTHNTELNVVVHGNENHAQLSAWFERLWDESQEFEAELLRELQQSWAAATATPHDIYMKTLYALVADRLDDGERGEILWDDELTRSLADFQKTAVRQAVQMIRDYGGAFVSDVVGLGKSYIGAAVVKHFVRTQGARPLIICPKPLEEMWQGYQDQYALAAKILPMSQLKLGSGEGGRSVLADPAYQDRDFVLVDESHNFRHQASQRYEVLAEYLSRGRKKVCLITATPRNRSALDVYSQIKLFHPDDITQLPIDPPNLKAYFKQIEKGEKRLPDLLVHILIRRTRRHILRWYGFGSDTGRPLRELSEQTVDPYLRGEKKAHVLVAGKRQHFPQRELETLRYSIEDTYAGLYDEIRGYLGRPAAGTDQGAAGAQPAQTLTYARYGLWHYLLPAQRTVAPYPDLQRAGLHLRGLIRVMLFKRLESSVHAFRTTLERLERIHGQCLAALEQGFVPAGSDAQKLLYESDVFDDDGLIDALARCSGRYKIDDFDADRLRRDVLADRDLLLRMIRLMAPITPAKDGKLQVLLAGLTCGIPQARGKVLVFSQYADTVRYLYENLNPGGQRPDVESIYGTEKNKSRMAARFSPRANPAIEIRPEEEVNILVATDVMSEGLNLQDCDVVVNYDLHWNPVRLIQRFGRIDRIGTENDRVWGFNFLPEAKLEQNLGLQEVLQRRIREIHDTIGEDAAILDRDEQVNPESMFAIYEKRGGLLSRLDEEQGELLEIGEAEEILRAMRATDRQEFDRIASLRDGLRSAREVASGSGWYVFCQSGRFQQLYRTDAQGAHPIRDVARILGGLKCSRHEPTAAIPPDHGRVVVSILRAFAGEARHRRAQQQYGLSLTQAQSYVLRELKILHGLTGEAESDFRGQLHKLETAFQSTLTVAVRRQLNTLRRNGVAGTSLVRALTDLYHEHGLAGTVRQERVRHEQEAENIPRIICSEAFV